MNKFLTMAGAALMGSVALAEGSTGSSGLDTTAINTLVTNLKTDLSSWVTSAIPILGGIAAVFMIFWLGKVVFRVLKGWANKAG